MRSVAFLKLNGVTKRFGGVFALADISIEVDRGEAVGIIGPNGSGKTTLLNVINGYFPPDRGNIYLDGRRIDGLPPSQVARFGVGRTFQVPKLFTKMTVLENMLVPAFAAAGKGNAKPTRDRAEEILETLRLNQLADEQAGALSGGQQKLLEFGRALMAEPSLLLLDEPFAAVHPLMKEKLIEIINKLNAQGVTVLVVSHEIPAVMKVSRRLTVMNGGHIIADGQPREVVASADVIEAYLGEPYVAER